MTYGRSRRFSAGIDEMGGKVRAALAVRGFGVLTEIDVAATLREKLGLERAPYKILGACNPGLAARALDIEVEIGLLLPCNVVLYDDGGDTIVSFVDPAAMMGVAGNDQLEGLAAEAAGLLDEALDSL